MSSYIHRAVRSLAGRKNYKDEYKEPSLKPVYVLVTATHKTQEFINLIEDLVYAAASPPFSRTGKLWKVSETLFAVFLLRYNSYVGYFFNPK